MLIVRLYNILRFILPQDKVQTLVIKRITYLEAEHRRISGVFEVQKHTISAKGTLLFRHTLHGIQGEIAFLKEWTNNWDRFLHEAGDTAEGLGRK